MNFSKTNSGRQTNIELLRIVAMFMVVIAHCNTFGAAMASAIRNDVMNWGVFTLIFTQHFWLTSLNCYVLVAAYFLVDSRFRLSKLSSLWIQLFFYSVGLTLLYFLLFGWRPDSMLSFFFPILTSKWWYVTVYFCLFLIFPFLNVIVRNISKHELLILNALLVILCTLVPYVADILYVQNGYSLTWFICLYFIAAYIRLHVAGKWAPWAYLLVCFAAILAKITVMLMVKSFFPLNAASYALVNASLYGALHTLNSVSLLVASVAFFLFFLNIKIHQKLDKIILWIAPLTFGVYLLHAHPQSMKYVFGPGNMFDYSDVSNYLTLFPSVIAGAFLIYTGCLVIEYLRQILFQQFRISKIIHQASDHVEEKFRKLFLQLPQEK